MRNICVLIVCFFIGVFAVVSGAYLYGQQDGIKHTRTYTAEDKDKDPYGLKNRQAETDNTAEDAEDISAEKENDAEESNINNAGIELPQPISKRIEETVNASVPAEEEDSTESISGGQVSSQDVSQEEVKIISTDSVPLGENYNLPPLSEDKDKMPGDASPLGENYSVER